VKIKWYHKTGFVLLAIAGVLWICGHLLSIIPIGFDDKVVVVVALLGLFLATGGTLFGSWLSK
jgi:hypothetical protein